MNNGWNAVARCDRKKYHSRRLGAIRSASCANSRLLGSLLLQEISTLECCSERGWKDASNNNAPSSLIYFAVRAPTFGIHGLQTSFESETSGRQFHHRASHKILKMCSEESRILHRRSIDSARAAGVSLLFGFLEPHRYFS